MLMNALLNHGTFTAHENATIAERIKSLRNASELSSLAQALDALFHKIGPKKAKDDLTAELLVQRMAAVIKAEEHGNWDFAKEIKGISSKDLLDHDQRQVYRKRVKLQRQIAGQGAKPLAKLVKGAKQKSKPASQKRGGADE